MSIIYRDTKLDDAEDSRILRDWRDHQHRYHGERPVRDTGRVQIGIAHRRRQLNDDPISRHTQRRIWHVLTLLSVVVFVGLSLWRCAA